MTGIDFDVAIIGGSLSGISSAFSLSKRGYRVALFEKESFPRRKACGEGLSASGKRLLDGLGMNAEMYPLKGYRVWNGRRSIMLGEADGVAAFGIQRLVLDDSFLRLLLASHSSVTPFLNTKVRKVEFGRDSVRVFWGEQSLTASKIIIADGGKSLTASRLGVPVVRGARSVHGASVLCSTTASLDAMQLVHRAKSEAYLTPVAENLVNVSFLGEEKSLRTLLQSNILSDELKRMGDTIGIDLTQSSDLIGVGAIAPISRPPAFGHGFLVGDATESLDPVSGMGMSFALYTGAGAGEILSRALSEELEWNEAVEQYTSLQQQLARQMRGYARAAGLLVRKVRFSPVLQLTERMSLPGTFRDAALSLKPTALGFILTALGL